MRTKTRKFGLIYLEGIKGQVDPEGKRAADDLETEMDKYGGATLTTKIGYTYDPGRNQQDLTTMIASMHNDGVTSIIMFVDPLYPILITGEAHAPAVLPRVGHQRFGSVRHHRRGSSLRPAAVEARVRHLPAVGDVEDGSTVHRLPRGAPRRPEHAAGRRGRADQHLPVGPAC